jgi:hypothetical protein
MDFVRHNAFGYPLYKFVINKKGYNKKEITKNIEANFKISKHRNNYDTDSYIHQGYNDFDNKKFINVDFSQVTPLYVEAVKRMLEDITHKSFKFTLKIINYACIGNGQFMTRHNHVGADFNAVHYMQYDKGTHTSTRFCNPNSSTLYTKQTYPILHSYLDSTNPNNSWFFPKFSLNTEEDDFIIIPACLEHEVPMQKSNKKRITVVMNISLTN